MKVREVENGVLIYFDCKGMGLCFIGKRKFSRFISQYIPNNMGLVKSIETDEILGQHYGLHRYTIGQRIAPVNERYKSSKPLFIAKKDLIENIIYAVRENIHAIDRIFDIFF